MEPSREPNASVPPEEALVLACASTTLDDARRAQIRVLARADLDWDRLRSLSRRHFVTPLVWESLAAACPDLVPAEVRDDFDAFFRAHAARNLGLVAELVRLVRRFDAAGVDVIAFKGPSLSLLAYGNHTARLYGDLDLLVPERDLDRSIRLLAEAGYAGSKPSEPRAQRSAWAPFNKDLVFVNDTLKSRVEVHWRLTGSHFPFPLDLEHLRRRAVSVELGGVRVRTLPLDDLLLYLCLHGSRHGWERLEWVCDVAELVRSQGPWDWRRLEKRARALGCTRNYRLGLLLASRLVGADVPPDVLAPILRDSNVCRVGDAIRSRLFDEPGQEIGGWRGYHLSVRERLGDRVRLHVYYFYRYARLATRARASEGSVAAPPSRLDGVRAILRPFRLGYLYAMRPLTRRLAGALGPRLGRLVRRGWGARPSRASDN